MAKGLGRRVPTTWEHVAKYPLTAAALEMPAGSVEVGLGIPWYWRDWDQGQEGACVGYGSSAMMAITNTRQALLSGHPSQHRYEPRWLYQQAQAVDEWPETPPEEGSSVRAACDVLRKVGHRRVKYGIAAPPSLVEGISANRWAVAVDEMRAAIFAQKAVAIGVSWYEAFDRPYNRNGERWLPELRWGSLRGGHCVCVYRMSDRRQAFCFMNSWGESYPPTWIPYSVMQRLLDEDGEAAVIVDR